MKQHIQNVQKVNNGGGGMVYCLGMIGALVYYLQHATSIQNGLVGIIKALFWPAFFVYKAIETFAL